MRNPDERRGDLRAQIAAHRLAERRLEELVERRGESTVSAAMDELYRYSDRVVRAALAELPDGRYEASDVLEPLEGELEIRAAVTIAGDEVEIDFTGTSPQHDGQPELPAGRDPVCLLLRRALPDRARPAVVGRRLRARDRPRARGLARQRAAPGGRRRREHRDVEPDRRRRLRAPSGRHFPFRPRARGR